ncbi:diguanylate cyclase domain-containing protein [Marinibacterium sp. SX1]|uniref:diguanylate cyclase domain-containing protein n=1 Tax=Marinibacterium sp. SX1 TaxID=3388424 RepID=UPI003D16ADB1
MTGAADLSRVLTTLCPMHLVLDATGAIRQVGPTLQKLRPRTAMVGARFLDLFEMIRPRSVATIDDLHDAPGGKLRLQFRDLPRTGFKGVVVPLGQGQGVVINLSFGFSVLDAVRDYALTGTDFSATDLTIEMLYLVEAKSAAMEASRSLNARLQGAMIAAEEQAFTDTLTGLKNRRALDHVMRRLLTASRPFAVMQLDLDFFKDVNDTLGHAAGDHVLQHVARHMVSETRESDIVARIGGDEFVLVLDRLQDPQRLDALADRLIAGIAAPIPFEGRLCQVSASVGSAVHDGITETEAATLLARADDALYAAKRAGRGRHFTYDSEGRAPVPG